MSAYVMLWFVYCYVKHLSECSYSTNCLDSLCMFHQGDVFGADLSRVGLEPVLRVVDGEDDPRVQVILSEGDQHSELILASQFLNHLL